MGDSHRLIDNVYGPLLWAGNLIGLKKGNRIWVDIADNYPTFESFTRFTVNNGKSIKFLADKWCDNQPLKALSQAYTQYLARKKLLLQIVRTVNTNLGIWPSEGVFLIES